MTNPTFIIAYEAAAAIEGCRIVTFDTPATKTTVTQAAAATVPLVGVSDRLGAASGRLCDIHRGGLVAVELGGSVSAGDPLTANADGKAVKAAPAAGTNNNIIGFADRAGVSGDIIDVFMAPGTIQG